MHRFLWLFNHFFAADGSQRLIIPSTKHWLRYPAHGVLSVYALIVLIVSLYYIPWHNR